MSFSFNNWTNWFVILFGLYASNVKFCLIEAADHLDLDKGKSKIIRITKDSRDKDQSCNYDRIEDNNYKSCWKKIVRYSVPLIDGSASLNSLAVIILHLLLIYCYSY